MSFSESVQILATICDKSYIQGIIYGIINVIFEYLTCFKCLEILCVDFDKQCNEADYTNISEFVPADLENRLIIHDFYICDLPELIVQLKRLRVSSDTNDSGKN